MKQEIISEKYINKPSETFFWFSERQIELSVMLNSVITV